VLVDDVQMTLFKFVDNWSTRKSIKNVSIMIVQKIIMMLDTKHFNKILLNENAKINVINYRYAIAHDVTSINNDLSISSHVKRKSMHCYDAYNVRIRLIDNWEQKRVFETMFYVLNKNEMSNIILELSELKQIEMKLNYQMFIWRYDFSEQTLKISSTNDFAKKINHDDFIYVVMIQSYKFDTKIKIRVMINWHHSLIRWHHSSNTLTLASHIRKESFVEQKSLHLLHARCTRNALEVLQHTSFVELLDESSAFDLYKYDSKRAIFDVDYQVWNESFLKLFQKFKVVMFFASEH
jgi:hypothetical protein